MRELLFLAHRMPYPPDKGDKIRSWNFLRHLTRTHRVHLGCFIDNERDREFEKYLRALCEECYFAPLQPMAARMRSVSGLLSGRPLTLPYYFDRSLGGWVERVLAQRPIATTFAYCSAMAQYIPMDRQNHSVVDLVDLDSQKWRAYARNQHGPKRWILDREAARLSEFERKTALSAAVVLLSTKPEAEELTTSAPDAAARIHAVPNGVDSDYFSPDRSYENPYSNTQQVIAFTGAMDYRPNAEAISYFLREVFPSVCARLAHAVLFVVGANPSAEVLKLADGERIFVTGRVPDIRPYIAHASVIVAPLRIARGIQNKVLEGMAMAKPVVASPEAVTGIEAEFGSDVLVAADPRAFAEAIYELATTRSKSEMIGMNARRRVLSDYSWSKSFGLLDQILARALP